MPTYVYTDREHEQEETHLMQESPVILCRICQKKMWRKPQSFRVNWNGLPPHLEHGRSAINREFIDPNKIAERRDDYEKNLSIVRSKKGQNEISSAS